MLLNVNYAAYAIAITAYVAFLLALVGLPELAVVRARVVNTALGGLCAFLGHFLLLAPRQGTGSPLSLKRERERIP